jgi:hypothetical protein
MMGPGLTQPPINPLPFGDCESTLGVKIMKSVDRAELNTGTIVSYALSMAIFNVLDEATKERVKMSVLAYLPEPPDRLEGMPADQKMWMDARNELKILAGQ